MKLIMAIVNNDDSPVVAKNLTSKGFSVTKLATTGGFLKSGNTTFIVGTADERVDEVISTIETYSKKRTKIVPASANDPSAPFDSSSVEVAVGGAAIFVLGVDRFEKC